MVAGTDRQETSSSGFVCSSAELSSATADEEGSSSGGSAEAAGERERENWAAAPKEKLKLTREATADEEQTNDDQREAIESRGQT